MSDIASVTRQEAVKMFRIAHRFHRSYGRHAIAIFKARKRERATIKRGAAITVFGFSGCFCNDQANP